jgi:hypothetical protein
MVLCERQAQDQVVMIGDVGIGILDGSEELDARAA